MKRRWVIFAGLLVLAAPLAMAVEENGWVEGKLQSMSLREKIGQMLMIDLKGQALTPDLAAHMAAGDFGNVIFFERNLSDAAQTRQFTQQLQDFAIVRTGVPLLTAVDQEGGLVNRLGEVAEFSMMRHSARTLGDVYRFKPAKAEQLVDSLTSDIATRMKELGFNMNLAPVLDLTSDKDSYIYDRSYGSDPESVSKIAQAYARVMRQHGIVSTGKHFPNLSQTRQDSHLDLPILNRSLPALENHEFVPFKRLKGDLGAIMIGHVLVPELDKKHPASVSPEAVKTLREKIGFDGVIITDDVKMRALSDRYPLYEIVLRSVFAGVDMIIVAWNKDKQLEAARVLERAVHKGKIPMSRIDESVKRILLLKHGVTR